MYEVDLCPEKKLFTQFNLSSNFALLKTQSINENQSSVESARVEGLVARAQNGDRDAFAGLYQEYFGPVYRYAYLRVGRTEQAEDLTQEVFLKALCNIRSFHFNKKPFVSWLFGIAHNLIIDQYRQSKRSQSIILSEQTVNTADDPVAAAEQSQEISFVKQAIEELPPREREIILLRFGAELSITETAHATGTSEGSVKKLQHEAIANLKKQMQKSAPRKQTKISGLLLDYDGTISPLNVSRQFSRVPPQLEALLNQMQEFVQIGVITSKDLNFILPRTSFAHAWGAIAGLEIKTGSQLIAPESVRKGLPALNQALEYARQNISHGGMIEEKCDYSGHPLAFCVDWRRVEDKKEAILTSEQILDYCKKLHLKIVKYPGKPYFDIFSCSINKGNALKRIKNILKLSGNTLYMGDSITDNAAFREADISIGVTEGKKPLDLCCQYWIKFEDVTSFLGVLFKNNFVFSPDLPGITLQK